MGTPYNFLQNVIPTGIFAGRYIGTVIQPKFFYGIDENLLNYEYTGRLKSVCFDKFDWSLEIASGKYVPAYRDEKLLKTEFSGKFAGVSSDNFNLLISSSGEFHNTIRDEFYLQSSPRGETKQIFLDNMYNGFDYVHGYFNNFIIEKADLGCNIRGKIYGHSQDTPLATMFFLTGDYYKGGKIEQKISITDEGSETFGSQYFFYTGRYQGAIS